MLERGVQYTTIIDECQGDRHLINTVNSILIYSPAFLSLPIINVIATIYSKNHEKIQFISNDRIRIAVGIRM